jgi:hypothetical protein
MGWACSTYGKRSGVYRILMVKPGGKRQLGRPRRRWEYSSEVYLQEVGYMGMDWIVLGQDRDRWRPPVNAAMKLRVT